MVKLIYPVWKEAAQTGDDFREQLLTKLAPVLLAIDTLESLRIQVVDNAVSAAAPRRMENCQPLPDGVVSVHLNGSDLRGDLNEPFDTALASYVAQANGYQVNETEVLTQETEPGQRVYGFCQVVFLQRPPRLNESEWLGLWQDRHTQVAIDTQATFGYRQNVIKKSFTKGAPVLHAMVEENFPPQAMTSDLAFYGVTNETELQVNLEAMLESCARFIDFDKIDVIPMSEYFFRA